MKWSATSHPKGIPQEDLDWTMFEWLSNAFTA